MVTMKDVAKLAGVSHGTVSNVINGEKNVSIDKIKKVEAAMKQLGYQPNTVARSLKMKHSHRIDFVVPNMLSDEYLVLYEIIRKHSQQMNYTLNLRVTDGVPANECAILKESLMGNAEGAIVITCQPNNQKFFSELISRGLKITFVLNDVNGCEANFIGLDCSTVVISILEQYRGSGKRVALLADDVPNTFHDQLISAYCQGISHDEYLEIIQISTQNAAKGAAALFQLNPLPDAVLVSNTKIAEEVHKMEWLLSGNASEMIDIIVLGPSIDMTLFNDCVILLGFENLGKSAWNAMMHSVRQKQNDTIRKFIIPRLPEEDIFDTPQLLRGHSLKILLNKSPSSAAVESLIQNFTLRTGIKAEVTTHEISGIYNAILKDRELREFDLYSIDLPWLQSLSRTGYIQPIDEFVSENPDIMSIYSDEVLDRFSYVDDHFFAVPFSFTAQILFYRQDLFKSTKNKRLYYEWYREELNIPKTWEEFNKIARLFTREFNPDSDTKYGVTMGGSSSSGASCEFFPRLWSMGGTLFDDQKFIADPKTLIKAMDNYLEAFRYANPKAVNWWWDEQVSEFSSGNAAMMMIFTEHAGPLTEKNHIPIAGKYSFAELPGKISTLGGWSMAIRNGTEQTDEAYEFLKWISDKSLIEQNALLGRVYPVTDPFIVEKLSSIFEWFPAAEESFRNSRARTAPTFKTHVPVSAPKVEETLGQCIHRCILEKKSGTEAVELLRQQFARLSNGIY